MAFTRIQIATVAAGSTNPNTLALTGCVAGRGLVACVTWDSTATVSAATMSGETVTAIGSSFVLNGTVRQQWFYVSALASGGSKTLSITWSASPVGFGGWIAEYSDGFALDVSATGTSGTSGTDKTIAIAPTVANCLLLAATGQGINDSNFTAAAGYTLLSNGASTWYGNGGLSSYSLGVENLDSGAAGSRSIGLVGQDSFASGISAIALKALVIDPNSACVAHLD